MTTKNGMSDLHKEFDLDQREESHDKETEILNYEMGQIQW